MVSTTLWEQGVVGSNPITPTLNEPVGNDGLIVYRNLGLVECNIALMNQLLLSTATIIFTILSAVTLRGFIYGNQQGDPEYYILLFSMLCGVLSTLSLWKLFQSNIN